MRVLFQRPHHKKPDERERERREKRKMQVDFICSLSWCLSVGRYTKKRKRKQSLAIKKKGTRCGVNRKQGDLGQLRKNRC